MTDDRINVLDIRRGMTVRFDPSWFDDDPRPVTAGRVYRQRRFIDCENRTSVTRIIDFTDGSSLAVTDPHDDMFGDESPQHVTRLA